jgi:hypothetical protein
MHIDISRQYNPTMNLKKKKNVMSGVKLIKKKKRKKEKEKDKNIDKMTLSVI